MCMFCIRISQLLVRDAHDLAVQLKSGTRDNVFMCMFGIRISQLLVWNAHEPVCDARARDVQLKSRIRNHVFSLCSVYVYLNCLSAMPVSLMFNQSPG